MVGNLTVENNAVRSQRIYSVVKQSGLQSLKNATTGTYVLSIGSLDHLRAIYHFREFRLRCYKNWHGKQVDVVLTYVDELTVNRYSGPDRPLTNDVDFYFLPDDQESTPNTGFLQSGNSNLYNHLFWRWGEYHIHIWEADRLECGDYADKPLTLSSYDNVGNWQWYLR